MPLPTTTVKNGAGADVTVNLPNSGRRNAADSQAMVLSNEDLATLASIAEKLPVLIAGRSPVDVPLPSTTTREYRTADAVYLNVAASSAAFALPTLGTTREVYIHAIGTRVFFRTGTDTVTASVAAGNQVIAADEKFHYRIPAGHTHVAVIGNGGTGNVVINPVA